MLVCRREPRTAAEPAASHCTMARRLHNTVSETPEQLKQHVRAVSMGRQSSATCSVVSVVDVLAAPPDVRSMH